jgi:hypothetical protein
LVRNYISSHLLSWWIYFHALIFDYHSKKRRHNPLKGTFRSHDLLYTYSVAYQNIMTCKSCSFSFVVTPDLKSYLPYQTELVKYKLMGIKRYGCAFCPNYPSRESHLCNAILSTAHLVLPCFLQLTWNYVLILSTIRIWKFYQPKKN